MSDTVTFSKALGVCSLAVLFFGCERDLVLPDAGSFDGGGAIPPEAPTLDSVPNELPYPLATLRGRAPGARRVLVRGGRNPVTTAVLPDGTFCIDVPLSGMQLYDFELWSQGTSGLLSATAATTSVAYRADAPNPPGATTCSGADPVVCSFPAEEICDNGRDDDCDGRVDASDPDCSTCDDDALEPNDTSSAPAVSPGRYDALTVCPGNDDYFRVYARAGETIGVNVRFVHATGDLDAVLFAADGTTELAKAESSDDDESLSFVATESGFHVVLVYGFEGAGNDYSLDVAVTR